MPTRTTAFFDALARRGHEQALKGVSGTLRVELADGVNRERWIIVVDDGDIAVSHGDIPPDSTLRTDRSTFDDLVSGRANATASVLRGTAEIDGDMALLLAFQRVFPGKAASASGAEKAAGAQP